MLNIGKDESKNHHKFARRMKKTISRFVYAALLGLFLLSTLETQAQWYPKDGSEAMPNPIARTNGEEKSDFTDRLFYAGGFGAQFGNVTFIEASPIIGIGITETIRAGVGFSYMYFQDRIAKYQTNIYGGRVFSQADIYAGFFAHVEYEILNGEFEFVGERTNLNSFLVGGGYRASLGGRFFGSATLLYNLTEEIYSPYSNPIFRVGFGYGL